MRIIANKHKTGAEPVISRTVATFEIRLYVTSDIIGDLTVINDIPMFNINVDPYRALTSTIEELANYIAKLIKQGENYGALTITRATVCSIEEKTSKRRLCYYSEETADEIFNNMLLIAINDAYEH